MLLTESGMPGGHSAVLSITLSPQLLSLQTGHPSHVVANFSREKEALKAHVSHWGRDESGTS